MSDDPRDIDDLDNDAVEEGFASLPHLDSRSHIRRHVDLSTMDALGVIATKASAIRNLLITLFLLGGALGTALVFLGFKQQTPADAISDLQHQINAIRIEDTQRDSLIRGMARGVALLTYYRCDQIQRERAPGSQVPIVDCVKALQENQR